MKVFKNKVAGITGAASGIGRMLAVELAKQGCEVAIADIDPKGLKETRSMVQETTEKCSTHDLDVARREKVYAWAAEVVKQHGRVDMIINNAGVGLSETLEAVSYDDFEWLMGINLWGVIYGSLAFLPFLKQRPEAHIVNVSSVNGFLAEAYKGPYCTAKYAVAGFTKSLYQELKGSSVRVSCVYPGGIRTNIVRNARFYKWADPEMNHEEAVMAFDKYIAKTSAETAARSIIEGIKKEKFQILVGSDARMYDWLCRHFPGFSADVLPRIFERLYRRFLKGRSL